MEIEKIITEIYSHLIKGLMIHEQLISYFNFLGLEGFSKQQEYHYLEESKNYLKFYSYYIFHYNKLVKESRIEPPEMIPRNWFSINRFQINTKNLPDLISEGFNKWINWEQQTKDLFQDKIKQLFNLGELALSQFLYEYLEDVDKELSKAESEQLLFESANYDMAYIVDIQKDKIKEYEKKIEKIY